MGAGCFVIIVFNVGRRRGSKISQKTECHQFLADDNLPHHSTRTKAERTESPLNRQGKRALLKHTHLSTSFPKHSLGKIERTVSVSVVNTFHMTNGTVQIDSQIGNLCERGECEKKHYAKDKQRCLQKEITRAGNELSRMLNRTWLTTNGQQNERE